MIRTTCSLGVATITSTVLLLAGCGTGPTAGDRAGEAGQQAASGDGAALRGSCAQGMLVGEINGLEATAFVSTELLNQFLIVDEGGVSAGGAFLLLSGEIRSGPYTYSFIAEIDGGSGYGDLVDQVDGARTRIRIDLYTNGFVMTTNVFEGGHGDEGSAQYAFACQ